MTIKTGFLDTSIDYGKLFMFRSVSFILPLQRINCQECATKMPIFAQSSELSGSYHMTFWKH